ncbi:MAG: M48 family metallopeptidase [Gammaproteobacteria bacterium]
MDFYGRQERARRASRWLVVAFAVAVTIVVLAVNTVVLVTLAVLNSDAPAFLNVGRWLDTHPGTVFITTILVLLVVVGSSLWKIAALRAGGKVVARDLGARLVRGDAADPLQRRLLNVVEEMAIASSVPIPSVYLLEEPAINALAAGYAPSEASVVVTRGALLALDRDELQGVIGHEFSHILSGDMRLNTQLVGFLHGLFVVSELGRWLGPGNRNRADKRRGGLFGWAGMALFVVGLVGLFVGRLLQAAVARQRERLADASAVQFTRESRGLRNALVKVGAHRVGSRLAGMGVDRVNHMLFASPGRLDFATHPPLLERIRALDPSFQSAEFGHMRHELDAREAAFAAPPADRSAQRPGPGELFAEAVPANAAAIASLVGNPGPAHVRFAEGMRRSMPADVRLAASDPRKAEGLLLAIAIGTRDRELRLAFVRTQLGTGVADSVCQFLPVADAMPLIQRLPAVLLLIGSLRQAQRAERLRLVSVITGLVSRGGIPTIFEYALRKSALTFLRDGLRSPRDRWHLPMRGVQNDLQLLLSVVAANGADGNLASATRAFAAGWARLPLLPVPVAPGSAVWVGPMDRALARLDRLSTVDKECVVQAMSATIGHDGLLNVAEAELLRLFCALLHCPLPPLLDGLRPTDAVSDSPGRGDHQERKQETRAG